MEDLMKSLPKEAQKAIEEVPVIQEIVEPEPQGFGWGPSIALVVGLIAAGAILKFGCKKLK
tara:strand:+ start:231 stop:413 length:183 start_codon:yes stop_codon:yes gene_type:complete